MKQGMLLMIVLISGVLLGMKQEESPKLKAQGLRPLHRIDTDLVYARACKGKTKHPNQESTLAQSPKTVFKLHVLAELLKKK